MTVWMISGLLGIAGIGFVVMRMLRSGRGRPADHGEVSQNWLTEHRANKQDVNR